MILYFYDFNKQLWNTSFPVGIVYWSGSAGVMSGPGDIRLLWESRAFSCTTATSGVGGGGGWDQVQFSSGDAM